jgi:hypothetical protein
MAITILQPAAGLAQELAVAAATGAVEETAVPAETAPITILGYPVSSWLLVRISSSIIGVAVFNIVMTSLTTVPPAGVAALPLTTVITNRIVASSLAATAAVGTMFAYDKWTGQPMDYDYAWSRAGFVAGATAASAALTGFGYQAGDWFTATWAAHRAILMGAGVVSGWAARSWYESR